MKILETLIFRDSKQATSRLILLGASIKRRDDTSLNHFSSSFSSGKDD
jgi:hypothetical protein